MESVSNLNLLAAIRCRIYFSKATSRRLVGLLIDDDGEVALQFPGFEESAPGQ
jgi:hypothetical protein